MNSPEPKITPVSKAVFVAYAKDAGNWSGQPLVGSNVGGTKGERGNLTQLKRAGLITTFESDGFKWIDFTDAGRDYALSLGIDICDWGKRRSKRAAVPATPERSTP